MKLVLLKEAARTGLFESEAAIRAMIARGQLLKDTHWFQQAPGARIRIDLDACVELFTTPQRPTRVPARGLGLLEPASRHRDRGNLIRVAEKARSALGLLDR